MKRIILASMLFIIFTSFMSLNAQWARTFFIGAINNNARSIQQTNDGGYIVVCEFEGAVVGYFPNVCLLKLDTHGEIEWQRRYGERSQQVEAYSIQQTTDGGYIAAGYWGDTWVLKLTKYGNIEWQRSYEEILVGQHSRGKSIQQTNDGGYIIAGYTYSSDTYSDFLVLKLSSSGIFEWQRTYGGIRSEEARSIQQTDDGGYIVSGYSGEFESGQEEIWV